jgi:hypothetical protein
MHPTLAQARSAWGQEQQRLLALNCSIEQNSVAYAEDGSAIALLTSKGVFEVKFRPLCRLILWKPQDSTRPSTCYGYNSRYGFKLTTSKGSTEWKIVEIYRNQQGFPKEFRDEEQQRLHVLLSPLKMGITLLQDVFDEATIVEAETEEVVDGSQCVRVKFRNPDMGNKYGIVSGEVTFIPEQSWLVKECDFVSRGSDATSRVTSKRFYVAEPNGKWRPERIVIDSMRLKINDPGIERHIQSGQPYPLRIHREYRYSYADADPNPPESAFTLTAFGLQEPPGIDWSPPTPWWLYASSGGVALLIVAVVMYRLSRRAA